MNLPTDKALVIIPTYNEIDNIENMIRAVFEQSTDFSLLIIEDGSPDGTAAVVKKLQGEYSNLHIIERTGKLGLGTAYITGFKWALEKNFEFIFEMDCDFSHDPKDLLKLLARAVEGADLVIGSRYIDGIRIINWPFRRLLLSYGAGIYTRIITGIPILDTTGGFKCFKRSTLENINLDQIISNGYSFQLELNYKVWSKGLKIVEHPIVFTERRDGESKMGGGIVIEAIFAVWRLRFAKMLGKLN
ncbi:MAG: polyprenol monophosphomannose synthase [Bacteriovoracaceae bacterium]|nr:polyprenol monophosphomannose synthase [Bacteriovoracaceae bacterium]